MTLIAAGPAGTAHDPFSGEPAGPAPEFDGTRYAAAGATEEELSYLAWGFSEATSVEQRRITAWLEQASDEELATAFGQWREQHNAYLEAEELTDGNVDEVLGRVGEDAELARRTLAAEHLLRGAEARKTLVEPLERLVAADDERAAAEQAAADRRAELTAGSVQDVVNRVGSDRELAAETLAAEQQRDGGPRTTLVTALEKLAAPADGDSTGQPDGGAEQPADGAEGMTTPPEAPEAGSEQQGGGAEASDASS